MSKSDSVNQALLITGSISRKKEESSVHKLHHKVGEQFVNNTLANKSQFVLLNSCEKYDKVWKINNKTS